MVTVTKQDLVKLGYGNSFSADIIKQAKLLMIKRGHTYYESKKLSRVPTSVVEEILGIKINDDRSD